MPLDREEEGTSRSSVAVNLTERWASGTEDAGFLVIRRPPSGVQYDCGGAHLIAYVAFASLTSDRSRNSQGRREIREEEWVEVPTDR